MIEGTRFICGGKDLFEILLMTETFLQNCSELSKTRNSLDQVFREPFHEI